MASRLKKSFKALRETFSSGQARRLDSCDALYMPSIDDRHGEEYRSSS